MLSELSVKAKCQGRLDSIGTADEKEAVEPEPETEPETEPEPPKPKRGRKTKGETE